MTTPTHWKPTATERREIRAFAARAAGIRPGAMVLAVNSRAALDGRPGDQSDNVLAVGGFPGSDLYDHGPWSGWTGCELVDGCAVVDLSVYSRDGHGGRELETQIQAVVGLLDGRPVLGVLSENRHRAIATAAAKARPHDWDRLPRPSKYWGSET